MDFKSPGKVELKIRQKHEPAKKAEEISGRELLTATLSGDPGKD